MRGFGYLIKVAQYLHELLGKATNIESKLDEGLTVNIEGSDIQLGAVELKDGNSDNRAVVDSSGRVSIAVKDSSGNDYDLAKDSTLSDVHSAISSLDSKVSVVNTDDVKVSSIPNVIIGGEHVDLAKDRTLQDIYRKVDSLDSKVFYVDTQNVTIDRLPDIVIGRDNVGLAKESTLGTIRDRITKCDTDNVKVIDEVAYDDVNDLKKVSLEHDSIGLAKDSSVLNILSKLSTLVNDLVPYYTLNNTEFVKYVVPLYLTLLSSHEYAYLHIKPDSTITSKYIMNHITVYTNQTTVLQVIESDDISGSLTFNSLSAYDLNRIRDNSDYSTEVTLEYAVGTGLTYTNSKLVYTATLRNNYNRKHEVDIPIELNPDKHYVIQLYNSSANDIRKMSIDILLIMLP